MPRIEDNARDEHFWHAIAQRYDVAPGPINLENGYFGRMTRGVAQDYQRQVDFINRSNSVHVRQRFDGTQSLEIRAHLADVLKVEPASIALTNRASDALQSLIRNYTGLQPGDQLLICDLEYHSVEYAMRWVAQQRGLEMIEITHAHPATYESLLNGYREAFTQHPRIKLMALTHVTHRTGLVMPVQAIIELAKEHGVDVILDGAHALGQIDFDLPGMGVAFAGFNLHKWIGAPLTLGFMYIDPQRLADIAPDMGSQHYPEPDIRNRAPYGTPNIPAWLSLPKVLQEHLDLGGSKAKGERLRALRDLWVREARTLPGIEVLTPDDPRLYCAITSLRFTHLDDQQPMVERLLKDYNLLTVARNGSACGSCIRITVGMATTRDDIHQLIRALRELAVG
ncbi:MULTISPECIES: aminotransferase class V-fold PLP-dependent enzyme [Pseudomonas]|uniref:Aminotransferase class V-fold PLP-dependent enzyme n=1 Tax=Pseudomonas lundensis TaxID=86185 RepID=A0ABX4GPL2_9PSED|nr:MULTISPECIES: aminotransferase class V-fold PLP-dependent enzyme [Pseudomonas]NMZ54641.1 aminotransferase class V-fold PLP-dependent enzyme [Pseudomonas lundensis]NNA13365.1 aminotransferase class V-fold PLP-dependent enzyme [Pseudomonas lundensis]OZY27355.1 aminotransferase class V-fold PLP-dependent enzyme [Pseudomonas lundensis]OZY48163.1 aminotransferase class V-fold PLP-dependent enzyme [Pseudomonas lundensis]OZY56088.1 aminotransferase class V-fold PLP-dependent enzyme [Pseudomonas lu